MPLHGEAIYERAKGSNGKYYDKRVGFYDSNTKSVKKNTQKVKGRTIRFSDDGSGGGSSDGSSYNVEKSSSKDTKTRNETSTREESSETRREHTLPLPDTPEAREYDAPEIDRRQISRYAAQNASAGLRNLRNTLNRATATGSDNLNVRAQSLREAFQGYGQGLAEVMTGAHSSAMDQYSQEYATETDEAKVNYSAQVRRDELEFENLMEEWKSTFVEHRTGTSTTNREGSSTSDSNKTSISLAGDMTIERDAFGVPMEESWTQFLDPDYINKIPEIETFLNS